MIGRLVCLRCSFPLLDCSFRVYSHDVSLSCVDWYYGWGSNISMDS